MEKSYAHQETEKKLYAQWETSGVFTASNKSEKKPFTIVLPPPNITGILHLGHALGNTIQDTIIRYKKMKNYEVLWVPGTDHAAIATENVVLKSLGLKKRTEISRKDFLKECKKFTEKKRNQINNQMKAIGSFLDWSREAYTLDEKRNQAVNTIFKMLWDDGLIVRGYRMVNWSIGAQSVLADDEVEYKEIQGTLYEYKYEIVEIPGEFLIVATTRPETLFGDTALAIHSEDERVKNLQGKHVKIPFSQKEIPIIFDEYVDRNFGTATLKVTPAHDPNDFEIGQRHNLPQVQVIGFDGKMKDCKDVPKEFQNLSTQECRELLTQENKWFKGKKDHLQNIGHCYRSKTIIEPMLSEQWFVAVNKEFTHKITGQKTTLKQLTLEIIKNNETNLIPERFNKIYFQWIENLRDWCISRQIWWGHRIPVWYGEINGKTEIEVGGSQNLESQNAQNIRQEEDTLDTWFSSALWPMSVFDWPNIDHPDFQKFFPTDLLETAHDILFFWVARMIMFTKYATGKTPFKTVYLHGIITDEHGKKMSKSSGNGIDPTEMTQKFGADAVRLALVIGTTPGNQMPMNENKIAGYRNFVNKLWNAGRFVKMQTENVAEEIASPNSLADRWIYTRFQKIAQNVSQNLEKYEIAYAGEKIYHFVWSEFCDWYIEASKITPNPNFLKHIFEEIIALTHPLCPFITETLYQELQFSQKSIVEKPFPEINFEDKIAEKTFETLQTLITEIRRIRAEKKIFPQEKIQISWQSNFSEEEKKLILLLSNAKEIAETQGDTTTIKHEDKELVLCIMRDKKTKDKEKQELKNKIQQLQARLENKAYTEKAPTHLIAETQQQLSQAQEKLATLK